MDTPSGALGVELTDHAIKLVPLAEDKRAKSYYLVNSVDWDYLSTIVVEHSD